MRLAGEVIVSADAAAWTAMLNCVLDVCPFASVTIIVNRFVPDAVGVPLIAPVDEFSCSPGGKAPDVIDHVYGVAPPLATTGVEGYATPTVPPGNESVVMVSVSEKVMVNVFWTVSGVGDESVTSTVNAGLTPTGPVGVPEITPAEVRINPKGVSVDPGARVQVYGSTPPVAISACE